MYAVNGLPSHPHSAIPIIPCGAMNNDIFRPWRQPEFHTLRQRMQVLSALAVYRAKGFTQMIVL